MESTGAEGCALNKWSILRDFAGVGQYYEQCVYRHLKWSSNEKLEEHIGEFLKEILDMDYGVGMKPLRKDKK